MVNLVRKKLVYLAEGEVPFQQIFTRSQ